MSRARWVFLLITCWAVCPLFAQLRTVPFWGFGVFGGSSVYSGELTSSGIGGFPNDQTSALQTPSFAFGGLVSYQWHPHMGLRLAATYGRLEGNDTENSLAEAQARGLSVETEIVEVSLQWTYDFEGSYRGIYQRPGFSPYVFAGVGGVWYRPGAELSFNEIQGRFDLREFRTEDQPEPYSRWTVAIPFGLGLRKKLSPRWDMRLELGLRKTFTDYLDDVSGATEGRGGRFPDPFILGTTPGGSVNLRTAVAYQTSDFSEILAKQNLRRGNPETDDWYTFGGVALVYLIETRLDCPKPPKGLRKKWFGIF